MTFFDFCEPSIEILPSFCLFRETPEIPDKIRRFVHLRQRREEVTCPILTPKSLLHMVNNAQNDTNRFGLDDAQYSWTHAGARILNHVIKVVLYPSCKTGISYISENGGKLCRVCKK